MPSAAILMTAQIVIIGTVLGGVVGLAVRSERAESLPD